MISKKNWQIFKQKFEARYGEIHVYDLVLSMLDLAISINIAIKLVATYGLLFGFFMCIILQIVLSICCIAKCNDMIASDISTKTIEEIAKAINGKTMPMQALIKTAILFLLHTYC